MVSDDSELLLYSELELEDIVVLESDESDDSELVEDIVVLEIDESELSDDSLDSELDESDESLLLLESDDTELIELKLDWLLSLDQEDSDELESLLLELEDWLLSELDEFDDSDEDDPDDSEDIDEILLTELSDE